MHLTNQSINYASAPVRIERKKVLDQWEDSVRDLDTIYYAKVIVNYDSNYFFRVSICYQTHLKTPMCIYILFPGPYDPRLFCKKWISALQAVAVDKGTGSDKGEGSAVAYSNPVYYHSKAFATKPTEEERLRQNIEEKYPSHLCK